MPKKLKSNSRSVLRSESLLSNSRRNSPTPPPSDFELFQPSESPEEDFGDGDDDKEWPVKGIVGWYRPDQTNTTWADVLPGANNLARSWNLARAKQRNAEARETPDINLSVISAYMPHNIHTVENAVAYNEKLKKWAKPEDDWDTETNQDKHERALKLKSHTSSKRKRTISHSLNVDADNDVSTIVSRASSSSRQPGSLPNKRVYVKRDTASTPVNRTRKRLQEDWNQKARADGAASLRIVNEVDDEEVPPVDSQFTYLESSCKYDRDVPKPEETQEFIIGCQCNDGCRSILSCSCIMDSQCMDENGDMTAAYDRQGLFLFNNQREVVECNESCACSRMCGNRVAQKPRKIPLEIFKTQNNGWGVRPSVDVPMGTVLGLYTGKIIRREALTRLTDAQRDYCFNLDARDDDPDCTNKYTVCALGQVRVISVCQERI
ncbi:hypothetical protein DFH11DRAFT_36604 [Phellopilus nigrolimitatus]|nr:hypothetical protein DFH11DRAFT_36604 [Phellopilus nigrolimitatus]